MIPFCFTYILTKQRYIPQERLDKSSTTNLERECIKMLHLILERLIKGFFTKLHFTTFTSHDKILDKEYGAVSHLFKIYLISCRKLQSNSTRYISAFMYSLIAQAFVESGHYPLRSRKYRILHIKYMAA